MTNEAMSFLPPLSPEEVTRQVEHILQQGYVPMIEYAEAPSPDEYYWRLWPLPKQDERTVQWVISQLDACRRRYSYAYVKLTAYDTKQSRVVNSFIAYLPSS